jgi:phage protein D
MAEDTRSNHNEALSYEVEVGGQKLTQQSPQGVQMIVLEEHMDMIAVAEVAFTAGGLQWSSLKAGDEIKIKAGSGKAKFVGIISEVRHTVRRGVQAVTIVAMDPLVKLGASRRTKTYEEVTDSDIASSVMSEAGVTPGTVDATSEVNKYVLQRNESDLVFLKRLAARNGYVLRSVEGKVNFQKPQSSDAAAEVAYNSIVSLDYGMTTATVPAKLTVYGWDYVAKQKVVGVATSGDIEKIGGGESGVEATGVVYQGESYISDVQVSSQAAAQAMAVAELNRLARGTVKGRCVCEGNGDIVPGGKVTFSGFTDGFNPEVMVISVRHVMDIRQGFTTEFHFVSNTLPK